MRRRSCRFERGKRHAFRPRRLFTGDEGESRINTRYHAPKTPARSAGRARVCGSYLFGKFLPEVLSTFPQTPCLNRITAYHRAKKETI